MTDLILQKWDSVIIDWVNCLELSKHIQSIIALKSGDFFKTLVNLLQPELPTSVREFIQTHYPCFHIPGEDDIFNDGDLAAVASLFLHFSCIYDQREQFTKPLCNMLSGNLQVYIRCFLEQFTMETTYENFVEVIKNSIEFESTRLKVSNTPKSHVMEWNSSGESANICNSPLLEYFKTPASKTAKMQEKDREMKQLQKELQLERFEKEDMTVEIKEQRERIQKISKEVHEKSLIISRLSAKLSELEEAPPTNKPRELIEIEKLLRSELADSQQYITQLQNEHGELIMHNEDLAKKLVHAEETSCSWQTKAVQYETKLDQLTSKYLSQEHALTSLQINYNELSALLDELRQTKANSSGYELDASSSFTTQCTTQEPKSSEEDLAATVVEIQLKECQLELHDLRTHSNGVNLHLQQTLEELEDCRKTCKSLEVMKHDVELALDRHILTNEQLGSRVNELTEKSSEMETLRRNLEDNLQGALERSQQLEDELMETKLRLDEVNNNNGNLQLRNDELMEKILTLQQSEEDLLATNAEIVKRVEEMTRENGIKDENLGTLRGQLLAREQVITNHEELIACLQKDFETMETVRNEVQQQLDEKNKNYTDLERESRALQLKYEEAVESLTQTDFNLQAFKKQVKECDNKMQVNIDHLEKLISGSIESSEINKIERFAALLQKLATKQSCFETTIERSKEVNLQLEEQIHSLKQADVNNKDALGMLQQSLALSQDAVKGLEGQIDEKLGRIQELQALLNEVTIESKELSHNLVLVEIESASRLQQNEFLTSQLEHSQKDVISYEKQVENLNNDKELLADKNSALEKSLEDLQTAQEELSNQLETAQMICSNLEDELTAAQEENSERSNAYEDLSQKITDLQTLHHDTVQKLCTAEEENLQNASTNQELSKTIKAIQSAHDDLFQKLVTIENDNSKHVVTIKDLNKSLVKLQKSHKDVVSNLALSEEKNSEHILTNQHLERTIMDLKHVQSDLHKEVKRLQDELAQSKMSLDNYKITLESLQPQYSKCCEDRDLLQASVCKLDELKSRLNEEVIVLRDQVKDNAVRHEELQRMLEESRSETVLMAQHNDGLQSTIEEMHDVNAKLTEEIAQLRNCLTEEIRIKEELLGKCDELQEEIQMVDLEHKKDVTSLQEEKSSLSMKIQTLHGEGDQLRDANHQLKEQLHALEISHETLTSSYETIDSELSISRDENDTSKRTIDELLQKIDAQLAMLKDKDSEVCYTKAEFMKKDLEQLETIKQLNAKIDDLEINKESLLTDLQVIKDNLVLKQQEFEDLQKNAKQLEKQLHKSTKQLETKQNLMKMTVENLEQKINDMEKEKKQVDVALAKQTKNVVTLSEDKNHFSNICEKLKDEMKGLAERLESKENECCAKDDIIENTNRELFELKLIVELKNNELVDCKACLDSLEREKSMALENANQLNNRYQQLETKEKSTREELKSIIEMRDQLTQKMVRLQENMQLVFTHFDIRKRNHEESLHDIMKYKDNKEAEIRDLNGQLSEVRCELERVKEEGHSARKELEARISTGTKTIQELESDIDALRITESGCLQEIGMLKEELNYTIDKYTEALQTEKDQKIENEGQIQSLTESVHDMLQKYNDLDKEHKQLSEEYNYNKKSFMDLQVVKEGLELEIVGLKASYDEDSKACRAEFDSELDALKKIERNLQRDVKELKKLLKSSNADLSQVRTELDDANSQLRIVSEEKCDLIKKIECMKSESMEMLDNYNTMNIKNEQYLKENKAALHEIQDNLKAEVKLRETTVGQKEKEIARLTKEVGKLSDRIKKEEEAFQQDINCRQKEIANLQTSIANFSQNIATLTKEKDALENRLQEKQAQCHKLLDTCNEKDEKVHEYELQIRNLQISHDILEAGKAKMEKLQQGLQERLCNLEEAQRCDKQRFETAASTLQAQLDNAHEQINENEQVIAFKTSEIAASKKEYDAVQNVLANMTKKIAAADRQLTVIHEDYEGKLKSERESFAELQEQYSTTLKEMDYMSSLNADLRCELDEALRERSNAENTIAVKEELIAELQQKYDTVANLVSDKDATIASLQAELAEKLVQLETTSATRRHLEVEHNVATQELQSMKCAKEEMIETHAEQMRNIESEMVVMVARTTKLKSALEERTTELELLREESSTRFAAEHEAKEFLQRRVLELEAQVYEAANIQRKLVENIRRFGALVREKEDAPDEDDLDEMILHTERKIIAIFNKLRDLEGILDAANKDKANANEALEQLVKCKEHLLEEKSKLLENFEKLHEEKLTLIQDKAHESKSLENLKTQYEALKDQQHHSTILQNKLQDMESHNKQRYDNYNDFLQKSQRVFKDIDTMVTERNHVEQIVCNLKDLYVTLQIKSTHITEDAHRLHYEQKTALEVIIDDIYKQFRRLSKMIYNLNLKCHQVVERTVSSIMEDKPVDWGILYKELNGEEILEKIEDLKDNAGNVLVQLETFTHSIEQLSMKEEKHRVLKENIVVAQPKPKEDEWKKKYMTTKQKLTLVENSKNNFERKVKQLREENKKLSRNQESKDTKDFTLLEDVKPPIEMYENDVGYKKLLGEYIDLKGLHQKETSQWIHKCHSLEQQIKPSMDHNSEELHRELANVKQSYVDLKLAYSKLQLDHAALEKMLSERNEQLVTLTSNKETYSNLCEENTKLKSEIDTLKYKRHRDREEFLQHMKKEESDIVKKVQAVRAEYDLKLEKMKEKIVSKYKEQVDQNETQKYEKINMLKMENEHFRTTIARLNEELARSRAKNELLDSEKHYALQQLKVQRDEFDFKEPAQLTRKASSHSLNEGRHIYQEERRSTFSLPRNMQSEADFIEVRYRRRTSIAPAHTEMEMEDEGDMFNDKYLHDLKEGRSGKTCDGDATSRLSEFVIRNSLCPPHLKSSYPAETQFLANVKFKDDDLKSGNIDFMDDTMKTQLLPAEKHKRKEGTSYKRPGPPTPSKHGGRPSLQGNERLFRESIEQKRTTPNPLKSLFSSSSKKDESTATSPRKRPSLSFFRR